MEFVDFLQDEVAIYRRGLCPDCLYKSLPGYSDEYPVVGILPPKRLLGVIISQDPTTDFKSVYLNARGNQSSWRNLIKTDAPPKWLIEKLKIFRYKFLDAEYASMVDRFEKMVYDNVYWTHLNKCCTSKQDKIICFRYKNSKVCADHWLENEIKDANNAGAQFIICLGGPVKRYFEDNEALLDQIHDNIFYLPHPSGAANGEWFNKRIVDEKGLKQKIEDMLLYCDSLTQ